MLKHLRRLAATVVLLVFLAAFLDIRNAVPPEVGHVFASSQFIPSLLQFAAGTGFAFAAVAVIVLTLAIGRLYCSVICPLGILQDLVRRIALWSGWRKHRLRYRKPLPWFRNSILIFTAVSIIVGWSGFVLALVDPYSHFGRMAASLFRPVAATLNNVIAGPAAYLGFDSLYRVDVPWAGYGALALPLLFLSIVSFLSARHGRLYCNTFCPVGTALGWLAKFGMFRLTIDREACRKCGLCLRECKADCIDLKRGTIDASRCVDCFDCLSVCRDHGIRFRFSWKRRSPPAQANESGQRMVTAGRRAFLKSGVTAAAIAVGPARNRNRGSSGQNRNRARVGSSSNLICPPGSGGIDVFLDRCTACQLCISSCPTNVLQPAFLEYGLTGITKPRLDFSVSFCNYDCTICGDVCPTGAILPLAQEAKHLTSIGEAHFHRSRCIVATDRTDCAACSEHCPTKAVETVPFENNLRIPRVNPNLCIGCGACEFACPVTPKKAITVSGRSVHRQARKPVSSKAPPTVQTDGFAF